MKIRTLICENRFWKKYSTNSEILWIKGFCNHSNSELTRAFSSMDQKELKTFISSLRGHFAILFISSNRTLIVIDRIGSSQINYLKQNNHILISPNLNKLKRELKSTLDRDERATLEINMGGFTIGKKRIYPIIKTPLAGQYVLFENDLIHTNKYFSYFGDLNTNYSKESLIEELSDITLSIFKKTLSQVGDKQIVIPLSAGNDSRLVASCLKFLGAKNVLCYSYGNRKSFEVNTAKKIASKLGYKWHFISLNHFDEKKFYKSNIFVNYLKFAESNNALQYFQGLSSIYYLKAKGIIEDNAVFINGNSGDFISGMHINSIYEKVNDNKLSKSELKDVLKSCYVNKHFSLWGNLKTKKNINDIYDSIEDSIENYKHKINKDNIHLIYEFLELNDRQSKYVIAGQKTFEYFNHDWLLPLWDDEYLFFWKKIAIQYKYKQTLYSEMLLKNNWGYVWSDDIPINKKNISSNLLKIVRFLFKLPFGVFGSYGKNEWKNFDKVFFYYWRDDTQMMKTESYFKVIKSYFRRPRNHVSFQADSYLNDSNENSFN